MRIAIFLATLFLAAPGSLRADTLLTAYQPTPPKYVEKPDGTVTGLGHDILQDAFQRISTHRAKSEGFMPWKRLQVDLEQGQLDFFFGMARNAAREKKYQYIDTPLYAVNHVAVIRDGSSINPTTLAQIQVLNLPVLTNKSSATARWLGKHDIIVDDGAQTTLQNLHKLLAGRASIYYFHDLGTAWTLRMHHAQLNRLRILPHSFRQYHHYLVFGKHVAPEIVAEFAQIVAQQSADGTLARIRETYVSLPAAKNPVQ